MAVDVVGLCKIRAYTSVVGDIGRTIQIIKDGVILKELVYTDTLFLEFYLPGRAKYTVKDLTSGYSQSVIMSAGEYAEVETGLTTSNWEGIIRIIKAGRASEFLEVGDVFNLTSQSGVVHSLIVAGINSYDLNEVNFVSGKVYNTIINANSYGYVKNAFSMVNTLYNDLPTNVQASLYCKGLQYIEALNNGNYTYITPTNKVWIPSFTEMGGNNVQETSWGHKALGYFNSNQSRLLNKNNLAINYALTATCTGSTTIINTGCFELNTGTLTAGNIGYAGIPWGFSIKP